MQYNIIVFLRYEGTDCALMCSASDTISSTSSTGDSETFSTSCATGGYLHSFQSHYQAEFGFTLSGRGVVVDDVRVRGIGKSEITLDSKVRRVDITPRSNGGMRS